MNKIEVLAAAAVIIFIVIPGTTIPIWMPWLHSRYETDEGGYREAANLLTSYPAMQPHVSEAMSDGVLTKGELTRLWRTKDRMRGNAELLKNKQELITALEQSRVKNRMAEWLEGLTDEEASRARQIFEEQGIVIGE